MTKAKIGILTAGGLAPCLSSAIASLIELYTAHDPTIEIICYRDGYKGLLLGNSSTVTPAIREKASSLRQHGGSPIGNSRVKLTNIPDCEKRGLVQAGENPLEVAAQQLKKDGITILHTIGGDDTNTMAAKLAAYLNEHDYKLTVVGLPKTVDNDVFPIGQTLGALTAAECGARFFGNVVHEFSANPRMLIIHEVMGRACGWLTAATARDYRQQLQAQTFMDELGLSQKRKDVHAVYLPEMDIDLQAESKRLREVMDQYDCVNIFLSEGAGVQSIIQEMESRGEDVPRDAFGHVKLDQVNPGKWFGKQFAERIGAEKVLVQKSGYYARSAPSNDADIALIHSCAQMAVSSALDGVEGVIGHDEDHDQTMRPIEFERIKGGKPFDAECDWFQKLLESIGQLPRKA